MDPPTDSLLTPTLSLPVYSQGGEIPTTSDNTLIVKSTPTTIATAPADPELTNSNIAVSSHCSGQNNTKPADPLFVYSRRPKDQTKLQQCQSSLPTAAGPSEDVYRTEKECLKDSPETRETLSKEHDTSSDAVPENRLDWAMSIALRNGVRSCAKYPLKNHLTYAKLSSKFRGFIAKVDSIVVPKDIQGAMQDPKWKAAVMEEMKALVGNGTWEIVRGPLDKKIVGCRWVFTVKHNADGSVKRYKARLVAQGFTQTYGIDYEETFAPVAKLNSIRVILSIAVNLDWPLFQFDIKNAFLNGDLDEEIYMRIPPGFEGEAGIGNACKLRKSLYGLKQSPRAWFRKFSMTLIQFGYQ